MKQIILGTAGHIDHGKTSLIKTLTGTDTDRLKEEKARGITIELGFASFDLPSGRHLGIVDVPGHEKFVKNMVAGATGIDMVVMVIAADEGVMPQTREHMEICTLLDIKYGLVALTKTDLVDEEWLEMVTEDVGGFTQGTFLEDAPVVPVSSNTGEGIPDLIAAIDDISEVLPERPTTGLFRLPVDRVFTMKGFGTVITGSLISGQVNTGDTIMVFPTRVTSKVRGIQVHNQSVDSAASGMRTAINFQGLDRETVDRGHVLAQSDSLRPSYMIDLNFLFLSSNNKALKSRTRVRFHTGTSEIMGNVILLDREDVQPGDTVVAQIRLDEPVALVKDDRFVIRSYSPVRTIGGGRVLNPIPPKHKRFRTDIVAGLQQLAEAAPEAVIDFHAEQASLVGVTFSDLLIMTNLPEKQLQNAIAAHLSSRQLVQVDKDVRLYIHGRVLEALKETYLGLLDTYHQSHPLKEGMPKEELKSKLPRGANAKLVNLLMNQLAKSDAIIIAEDTVRLAAHKVALQIDQAEVSRKIVDTYKRSGLTPPYFKELRKELAIDAAAAKDVLMLLVNQGEIVKVKEELYFHQEALNGLKDRLVDFLRENEEIATPEFKEMTGASRKYVIPLLEYFDAKNITIRVGDVRKLRGG